MTLSGLPADCGGLLSRLFDLAPAGGCLLGWRLPIRFTLTLWRSSFCGPVRLAHLHALAFPFGKPPAPRCPDFPLAF